MTQKGAPVLEAERALTNISRRSALVGGGVLAALGATSLKPAQASARTDEESDGGDWIAVMPAITRYIAGATSAAVPSAIRERARLHILDTLASIIACSSLEAARYGRQYAVKLSGGLESPILGSMHRASLIDATFASAMTAHAAEINDFIPSAYVQPGPAIVSAGIALAHKHRRSGHDLVSALVAGYELAGRLPKAIGTRNLWKAGLANHGIGPVFGTGAASAALLGLDERQVNHMLAYCAQQASGSWQWMLDVQHVEKAFVFAGMGARNGLQAALMASMGFTGVPDSLDAPKGWFRWPALSGEGADPSVLIEGLGETFEMSHAAMKRYPVGGPTQPAVRALLDLRREIGPQDVAAIRVEMPGSASTFRSANMPALNIPYLAAIIMIDGRLDFVDAQSLERMNTDARAKALAAKVEVVADPTLETGEGEARTESARVTLTTKDGKTHQRFVPFVPGFPTHPLQTDEVEQKARELVVPVLGKDRAKRLIALCASLDNASSIEPLVALMRFQTS